MYAIFFTNSSLRLFKKLPRDVQNELKKQIKKLVDNPLIGAPLKGLYRNFRSLHISYSGTSYRVIYRVFPKTNTLIIYLADKRENIYRRLLEMKIKF